MPERQMPLVFALQHLHVRSPEGAASPEAIISNTRLMQGEREIPQADDAEVASFLAENHDAEMPPDVMLQMIRMDCPDWPDAAIHALQGVAEFGPGGVDAAAASAHRALESNRNCKLARQLVKLLSAKQEVRIPFGSDPSNPPDVPKVLGG